MDIEIFRLTRADIPGAVECIQKAFADDPAFKWLFNDPSKYNAKRNAASLAADLIYGLNCGAPIHVAKTVQVETTTTPSILDKDLDTASLNSTSESSSKSTSTSASTNANKPNQTLSKTRPKIVGVAVWLPPSPPHKPISWTTWTQDRILSLRQLVNNIRFGGRGGLNLRRYWALKASQKRAHEIEETRTLWDPRGYYFCTFLAVSEEVRGLGVGRRLVGRVSDVADFEGIPCYLESSKGVPNVEIYRRMGFEVVRRIRCGDGEDCCMLYGMVRRPRGKFG